MCTKHYQEESPMYYIYMSVLAIYFDFTNFPTLTRNILKMTGGTPEERSDKSLTLLTFGPMDQWTNGPMDQWTNGPMDQWTN